LKTVKCFGSLPPLAREFLVGGPSPDDLRAARSSHEQKA
jgi:hypothetical protein